MIEFLRARVAEDGAFFDYALCRCGEVEVHDPDCPTRGRAECEAKRLIAEEHAQVRFTDVSLGLRDVLVCATCHGMFVGPADDEDWLDTHEPVSLQQPFPCRTLRALALPYADHPDFDPEWRI